jgi:hypothetical protein
VTTACASLATAAIAASIGNVRAKSAIGGRNRPLDQAARAAAAVVRGR